MKNRVTVNIAGGEYRLIGAEDEEYTRKVAAHVDSKINEVLKREYNRRVLQGSGNRR